MSKLPEFLNLIKESDAAIRGSQVTEKIHHSIYKKIQSVSNINSIRSGNVYTLNVPIKELEILDLPRNSYLSALKNLIRDKLITQLCIFFFVEETKEFKIQSCYISLPTSDDITTQQLYFEVIQYSIKNIKKFIDSKPKITKQDLLKDFEFDLKSLHKPHIEKLPNTLFDPTYYIVPSIFDINPEPEVLATIKKDLRNELVRQKILIELFEYGLMQIREDEILIRYESADEFMRTKVIPKYKNDPNLKTELDAIFLEESAYYIEPFVPKTSEHSKKIAESLKKNITSKSNTIRFPGMLPVEIIRSLSDFVNDFYSNQYKNELYQLIQYYLDKLKFLANQSLEEVVLYLSQEELEQINPKVIDALKNSLEVMYLKWNIKDDVIHIFAYKEKEIFHKIVSELLEKPIIEHWKVLALKFLIEQYENEYPNLFDDPTFKEAYGKLLRKVYINYMPWYFKIIILINFPFFQDIAFRHAKEKITKEQQILEQRNNALLEEKKLLQIQEKKEKLAKAKEINTLVRIMNQVEQYFTQGKIPYIKKIIEELPGWEEKEFIDYLKKQNFVLFPLKEDKVILYPQNFNWKIYATRIQQILNQQLQNKNFEIEKNKIEFTKIRSFIDTKLKGNFSNNTTNEDPYEKLGKMIEKEKAQIKSKELPDEIEI
jgi:hypothetical protein